MDFVERELRTRMGQHILTLLFIIYLILGLKTPAPIATIIDNMFGKIVIVILAIALFGYTRNPVLGVLGLIVAFDLIRRSTVSTGTYALDKYVPSETRKYGNLTAYNQFPMTLEQEVVKRMAPIAHTTSTSTQIHFSPMLDDNHDAAPINYTGVI
jgi:hypothetical protein